MLSLNIFLKNPFLDFSYISSKKITSNYAANADVLQSLLNVLYKYHKYCYQHNLCAKQLLMFILFPANNGIVRKWLSATDHNKDSSSLD